MTEATMIQATKILDWDDAYTNGAYIADGAAYPAKWAAAAQAFRAEMTAAGRADSARVFCQAGNALSSSCQRLISR